MNQQETDRRNEAIALFMGWKKVTMEHNGHSYWECGESQRSFLEYTDWNALMPVVDRIIQDRKAKGWLFLDGYDEPYSIGYIPGKSMNGIAASYYFWYGELGSSYSDRCFMCSSMLEAYWMAVSDYCLSLTAPNNV